MNSHVIGYIGIAFGIILLLASIFASSYSERKWVGAFGIGYWKTTHPYKEYTFPLGILGFLSLVVGIAGFLYRKKPIGEI